MDIQRGVPAEDCITKIVAELPKFIGKTPTRACIAIVLDHEGQSNMVIANSPFSTQLELSGLLYLLAGRMANFSPHAPGKSGDVPAEDPA